MGIGRVIPAITPMKMTFPFSFVLADLPLTSKISGLRVLMSGSVSRYDHLQVMARLLTPGGACYHVELASVWNLCFAIMGRGSQT